MGHLEKPELPEGWEVCWCDKDGNIGGDHHLEAKYMRMGSRVGPNWHGVEEEWVYTYTAVYGTKESLHTSHYYKVPLEVIRYMLWELEK